MLVDYVSSSAWSRPISDLVFSPNPIRPAYENLKLKFATVFFILINFDCTKIKKIIPGYLLFKKNYPVVLFPQSVVIYDRSVVLFPQSVVLFLQSVMLFPQSVMFFPQSVILFPQSVVLIPQCVVLSAVETVNLSFVSFY
jgi:hypothetical protein